MGECYCLLTIFKTIIGITLLFQHLSFQHSQWLYFITIYLIYTDLKVLSLWNTCTHLLFWWLHILILIKVKIRFIVMYREIHGICPPLLTHPGWHLLNIHAHGHTLRERCHTLEQWAANHSARGAWGYSALLKGTSAVARRWTDTPSAVSFTNQFLWVVSGTQTTNLPVTGRPTPITEPRPYCDSWAWWTMKASGFIIIWSEKMSSGTIEQDPTMASRSNNGLVRWIIPAEFD